MFFGFFFAYESVEDKCIDLSQAGVLPRNIFPQVFSRHTGQPVQLPRRIEINSGTIISPTKNLRLQLADRGDGRIEMRPRNVKTKP